VETQTRNCQNCKADFQIESEDFNFYEKIKVPAPTWCSKCRMERRMSFINTWNVYFRNCDKCGQKTLSMYPPEQEIVVYCQPCFWADDWDGTEYGMDYDPNRPFLEQVNELSKKTPFSSGDINYTTMKNSDYSNGIAWSKNCYLTFWADYCEDVYYSSLLNTAKDISDSLRIFKSELCYESIGQNDCYRVFYSQECDACVDVWFSRNCYSCTNCVGCVNLRGASYQIFNVQYSKEEYSQKLKELKLDTRTGIEKLKKEADKFWQERPYRFYTGNTLNLNSTGEYLFNSKNSKEIYIGSKVENSKWCQFISVSPVKDCVDYSGWGNNAEMVYESASVGENASNVKFSQECFPDCLNIEYCQWVIAGKNNFGCVSLKRKHYCILNKEYSKEEYEKLKAQIIEDMEKNPYIDDLGRTYKYGEFFPLEMSKFCYNKSNVMKFLPKTKEQAISEGYNWSDKEDVSHTASRSVDSLPECIVNTDESILNDVIGCGQCGRGYKITQGEFGLLRKMNLPTPHECPKCRENKRFARLNKPGLYSRICAKCSADIYTPYSPDRPEIVYCVHCYQQEFA
jgi:hypothetical protein